MEAAERLDRFFSISERGSTLRTEVKGGLLVFLSMSYIMVVNSSMMAEAGMDRSACYTATILIAIAGSLLMALYARYPVAQAPTMGVNAFFTYTIVLGMGFTWQEALAAVFISGLIFLAIAVSGVRKRIMDQIPQSLRAAITAGIGCFIVFIGLRNAEIIVGGSTLVTLGDLTEPSVALAMVCIVITLFLYARKVPAAIIVGMFATAAMGMAAGVIPVPDSIVSMPTMPEAGAFLEGLNSNILSPEFAVAVVALTFVQFFDSSGTLMAVGERAGIVDGEGNVQCERALIADSATSVISAAIGATPAGSYAESTVGIEAGARTGMAALVVALMFAAALFVGPVFQVVDYSCTVGAMMIVGAAMMTQLRMVDWGRWPEAVSVMATILVMVLAYSITDGIVFGVIFYCVCMIGAGRAGEVSPVLYALAAACVIYLVVVAGAL